MRTQLITLGTTLLAWLIALPVSAQVRGVPDQIVPSTCNGPDCSLCDLAVLIQNIINFMVYLGVVGSALLFAYAGWLWLTSAERHEVRSQAKKVFTNVAIGLVIVLSGWIIVDTLLKNTLGGRIGPWNQLCPGTRVSLDQ
jgi:cytochrome bd-type quinol oxidase subunit 2